MENPIKMDDLGGPPLFLETPICNNNAFPLLTTDHYPKSLEHQQIQVDQPQHHFWVYLQFIALCQDMDASQNLESLNATRLATKSIHLICSTHNTPI